MIKSVPSSVYTKEYYLQVCLGSEQFKKSQGKMLHPRVMYLLSKIPLPPNACVLDVGCGRGDLVLYLAKFVKKAIGIDYSSDGIALAEGIRKKAPKSIQQKTAFYVMNIKKLQFPDNSIDVVICIDVLEHLYKPEVEIALREISRVLKKDGVFFFHTGPNKILEDFTYPFYIHPVNKLLTNIDQYLKRVTYDPLPNDPRTEHQKEQHVNEPTYFYIHNVMKRHGFLGKIEMEVGFVKEGSGLRTRLYNFFTTLYPLSRFFPLNILFGWVFVGVLRNQKVA